MQCTYKVRRLPRCVQDVGGTHKVLQKTLSFTRMMMLELEGGPKPHTRIVLGRRIFEDFPQQDFGMDVDIKNACKRPFHMWLCTPVFQACS